jgi:hypothetical protein
VETKSDLVRNPAPRMKKNTGLVQNATALGLHFGVEF